MNRTKTLLELRPLIKSILNDGKTSDEETFQNNVLRPVIKFQHDLIIILVEHTIIKFHKDYSILSSEKKVLIIESIFNTNNQLKNDLRGIIIGLFSIEEYEIYYTMKSTINKRIVQIIKERVLSIL